MAASFSAANKKHLFSKIGKMMNLKKTSEHILQLLQMGNSPKDMRTEISKYISIY